MYNLYIHLVWIQKPWLLAVERWLTVAAPLVLMVGAACLCAIVLCYHLLISPFQTRSSLHQGAEGRWLQVNQRKKMQIKRISDTHYTGLNNKHLIQRCIFPRIPQKVLARKYPYDEIRIDKDVGLFGRFCQTRY